MDKVQVKRTVKHNLSKAYLFLIEKYNPIGFFQSSFFINNPQSTNFHSEAYLNSYTQNIEIEIADYTVLLNVGHSPNQTILFTHSFS